MGYGVYWSESRKRWQGYGIPALCDYPGCKEEIDRGLGYQHSEDEGYPSTFCCSEHQYKQLENIESKECPTWLNHVLSDDSWEKWRIENPNTVLEYKEILDKK